MSTLLEQLEACATLEEVAELKPLLEIERDNAKASYDQCIENARKYKQLIHDVPALIGKKGYEISFPESE